MGSPRDEGEGARSRETPEPEDSVEIRLGGRCSEDREDVADGPLSLLLIEAVERRSSGKRKVVL